MYTTSRNSLTGKTIGVVLNGRTHISLGGQGWAEFLEWNAKQPVPLDLSDKAPDPVPEDEDKAPIDALISKDPGDWSALELRQAVALVLKRVRKGM